MRRERGGKQPRRLPAAPVSRGRPFPGPPACCAPSLPSGSPARAHPCIAWALLEVAAVTAYARSARQPLRLDSRRRLLSPMQIQPPHMHPATTNAHSHPPTLALKAVQSASCASTTANAPLNPHPLSQWKMSRGDKARVLPSPCASCAALAKPALSSCSALFCACKGQVLRG